MPSSVESTRLMELKNGVQNKIELPFEQQPQTIAIQEAVKILLKGLGEDINRDGLIKTPFRVAKAFREGTRGYLQSVDDIVQGALFPEAGCESGTGQAGGVGGLVVVRDLDHFSYCECCLLPFQIKCHVGYVPSEQRVLGLSKLSRVTNVFAKRLQHPQRLADEISSALQFSIRPAGVAILLQCSHICFPHPENPLLESNYQKWSKVTVTSGTGIFQNPNADIWRDFVNLLSFRCTNLDKTPTPISHWCPSQAVSSTNTPVNSEMVDAVSSILRCLGEDPLRNELLKTPIHFVKWLKNFKIYNLEMELSPIVTRNPNVNHLGCYRIELDLSFWSQCEHHLLPFHGVAHIGYICGEEADPPVEKSILQSIVHFHGFKLQVQERLTKQIAETVSSVVGSGDVMVVIEADHTCMISRGVEKIGSNTATIAVLGRFSTDPTARGKFLQSIPKYSLNQNSV